MKMLKAALKSAFYLCSVLTATASAQMADLRTVAFLPVGQNFSSVGNEFDVEIQVGKNVPASDLYGISFILNYDSTLITALDASSGNFLGSSILFLPMIESGKLAVVDVRLPLG